jgi:hypothetical protein
MVGIPFGVDDDPYADAARSRDEGRPAVSEPSGNVRFARNISADRRLTPPFHPSPILQIHRPHHRSSERDE